MSGQGYEEWDTQEGAALKALWIFAFLTMIGFALPVRAQTTAPSFVTPNGEKGVGKYVWVWVTQRIPKNNGVVIEADCPVGYVVLGGGYTETRSLPVGNNGPNAAFDAWAVEAFASYSGSNKVTVYASCAPKSGD